MTNQIKEKVTVIHMGDYESTQFGQQIAGALSEVGYDVQITSIGQTIPPIYGVRVDPSDYEHRIVRQLQAADIKVDRAPHHLPSFILADLARPIVYVGLKAPKI